MSLISRQLAMAACHTRYSSAPKEVQERLLFAVADTLAVLISGSSRQDLGLLRNTYAVGSGPSTLIGLSARSNPSNAAFVNALPITSEQLQDGHRLARGHPMAHLIPAVLAVAESEESSGSAMLSALLAGYELGVRLGIAMGGTPRGVHDIGTWAMIGSCAAVAYLLSDGEETVVADATELAAASLLAFDAKSVFDGFDGQHLFLGIACQNSVVLGYAAGSGVSGYPGTLERFYLPRASRAFNGSLISEELEEAGRWSHFELLDGYHKLHPTCAHLHGVNDAVENITEGIGIDPGRIESVVVETYSVALEFVNPHPANDLAARFSIPYTVAVALIRGHLDIHSFDEALIRDQKVSDLASIVQVIHDPDLDLDYPAGRPARVTVFLKDEDPKIAQVKFPRGDGALALTDADIAIKPFNLIRDRLGADMAGKIIDAIWRLPDSSVSVLSEVLFSLKLH